MIPRSQHCWQYSLAAVLTVCFVTLVVAKQSWVQGQKPRQEPEYLQQFLDVAAYPHVIRHVPELSSVKVLELMRWVHTLHVIDDQTSTQPQLLEVLSKIHTCVLALGQPGTSYAVSRRMTLGVLLLQKKQLATKWDEEADRQLESICLQLFKLHQQATASKAAVSFFHISKAGGTSMCKIAKANKCRTQSFGFNSNCRIKSFGDFLSWTVKGVTTRDNRVLHPYFSKFNTEQSRDQKGCTIRYRTMKANDWNFHANELYLPGGGQTPLNAHACENFLNVVLLREPIARIVSHLRYMTRWYKLLKGRWPYGNLEAMMSIAPAVTNNYYIRSLLGKLVFNLPGGSISRHHLELAKLKLHQFDIILSLEETMESDTVMKVGMGWDHSLEDIHANKQHKPPALKADWGLKLNTSQQALLTSYNSLDMELYNYTMEVFQLDHQFYQIVAGLAAQGRLEGFVPSPNTTWSCGYAGAEPIVKKALPGPDPGSSTSSQAAVQLSVTSRDVPRAVLPGKLTRRSGGVGDGAADENVAETVAVELDPRSSTSRADSSAAAQAQKDITDLAAAVLEGGVGNDEESDDDEVEGEEGGNQDVAGVGGAGMSVGGAGVIRQSREFVVHVDREAVEKLLGPDDEDGDGEEE